METRQGKDRGRAGKGKGGRREQGDEAPAK